MANMSCLDKMPMYRAFSNSALNHSNIQTTAIVVDGKEFEGSWVIGFPFLKEYDTSDVLCIADEPLWANGWGDICGGSECIKETLSRATGYCDKNGTHIFEGDVVQCYDLEKFTMIVTFDENTPMFEHTDASTITLRQQGSKEPVRNFRNTISLDAVVIGNIYENPEFLKKLEERDKKLNSHRKEKDIER